MNKKELKQRIRQLESEIRQAKSNEEIWKDMVCRFIEELKGYGVKAKIIPAKPPIIEVFNDEDMCTRYVYGKTTEPPTLSFDFAEHDKKIQRETIGKYVEIEKVEYV